MHGRSWCSIPNWFTTSFLQPLLITPLVSKNCQLTNSCSMILKLQQVLTDELYQTFLFISLTTLLTPAQVKPKSVEYRRDVVVVFLAGADASRVYVRARALGCFHSLISTQTPSTGLRHPSFGGEGAGKRCSECDQYPDLSEGADRVGGQLPGDKKCPLQWHNQFWQSLEEGAGKRCSEWCSILVACATGPPVSSMRAIANLTPSTGLRHPYFNHCRI